MTVVQTALGYQAGHLKKKINKNNNKKYSRIQITEIYIEIPKLPLGMVQVVE